MWFMLNLPVLLEVFVVYPVLLILAIQDGMIGHMANSVLFDLKSKLEIAFDSRVLSAT